MKFAWLLRANDSAIDYVSISWKRKLDLKTLQHMNNPFTALKNQLSPIFVKYYTTDVDCGV